MKLKNSIFLTVLSAVFVLACGINSVTKQQIENVKAGDVMVYRYKKADDKTWFYADKITRIEGDKIFYNPSKSESTAGNDDRLKDFQTDESSITKSELLKYETEQGDEKKVIIWIK